MQTKSNYHQFNARSYLREYYQDMEEENEFLLQFHHTVHNHIPFQTCLLELGGGPCIYQLISAATNAKQILFAEYTEEAREEIVWWITNKAHAFNWDAYIRYVLALEEQDTSSSNIQYRKNLLKSKLLPPIYCDLKSKPCIESLDQYQQMISSVAANFACASIAENLDQLKDILRTICSLVPENGFLIFTEILGAQVYSIENQSISCLAVSDSLLEEMIKEHGFSIVTKSTIKTPHTRGYSGVLAILAQKKEVRSEGDTISL